MRKRRGLLSGAGALMIGLAILSQVASMAAAAGEESTAPKATPTPGLEQTTSTEPRRGNGNTVYVMTFGDLP